MSGVEFPLATATLSPQVFLALLAANNAFANVGAGSGSAAPAALPSASEQLQLFLAAIPIANDGDVITPDHHNTLREAIGAIARGLEDSQFARVFTRSFVPELQPVLTTGVAPFRLDEGKALGPGSGNKGGGWMELDLPDGVSIDSLRVAGTAPRTPSVAWSAAIRRKAAEAASAEDVIKGDLKSRIGAAGFFSEPFSATPDGLTPTQAAELRRVDNAKYRYLFSTTLSSTSAAAFELSLVQVTCIRG